MFEFRGGEQSDRSTTGRVAILALVVTIVTIGLAVTSFLIDPWTGESSETLVLLWCVTVPLALRGFPFLLGTIIGNNLCGNSLHCGFNAALGFLCQYGITFGICWSIINGGLTKR
ncbi:MAG: hypothetical protein WKF77_27780 [Planctomycetaceae bacterium]